MRDRLSELQRIAESLVSRAGPLDHSPVREQRAALDALQLLDSLGETAHQSVKAAIESQSASQQPAAAAAATASPSPAAPASSAPVTSPESRSEKIEHNKPALKNEDLVQALLEYSKRRRDSAYGRSRLIKAEELERANFASSNDDFAPMEIPRVDAQPKGGSSPRRPLGSSDYTVLRDTPSNSKGFGSRT